MQKLFLKIILILIVPASIGSMNYIVDPLQFYHKETRHLPELYDQQRYQAPGIAKNYDYDTAIVGTSVSENVSLTQLSESYGLTAVRLTMSGSSAYEQRLILDLAIKHNPNLKRVIWDVNFCSLSGAVDSVRDQDAAFPFYFYDNNPLNDFKYLLNSDTTMRSIGVLRRRAPYDKAQAADELERLNAWHNWAVYGSDIALESFKKEMDSGAFKPYKYIMEDYEINKLLANIDENAFILAAQNPQIHFDYYFPPFSILEHASYNMQGTFENQLAVREYIWNKYSHLENVSIYDFQTEDFISNLDMYKDRAHYNAEITSQVITQIMRGQKTTPEQFAQNQIKLKRLVDEFDFAKF